MRPGSVEVLIEWLHVMQEFTNERPTYDHHRDMCGDGVKDAIYEVEDFLSEVAVGWSLGGDGRGRGRGWGGGLPLWLPSLPVAFRRFVVFLECVRETLTHTHSLAQRFRSMVGRTWWTSIVRRRSATAAIGSALTTTRPRFST